MSIRQVALIRGINVGRAKRVAMADLRALVEGLGYGEVRTLLNSGNVAFTSPRKDPERAATRIEAGLRDRIGVPARVVGLTAAELATIVAAHPLRKVAKDPSRLLVSVLADPADRARLAPLARQDWTPDALALGPRAAYLWCATGLIESRLNREVARMLGDRTTARNWATMTKLLALAESGGGAA
jgi:uncharacterized protein (DUF1697 family)